MKKHLLAMGTLACLAVTAGASEMTAKDYSLRGLQHVDAFPGLASLCDIDNPLRNIAERKKQKTEGASSSEKQKQSANSARERTPITAMQVFDNLYFVGHRSLASWALNTSEGIIIIDTMNNSSQAEKYIEGGLKSVGLNPENIKYIIIAHEHGDHYGGQQYLVDKYQPRVVMGNVGWTELEKPVPEFTNPRWGEKPKRDVTVRDGDTVTLGETTVQVYETPGHTPGTISLIFPVTHQGKTHHVSLWGGTGLNYGPHLQRILSYSESAKRFKGIAAKAGVDIFMSNHPTRDGADKRLRTLAAGGGASKFEQHPFVIGPQQVANAYDMLHDCTYAQAMKIQESL